MIDFRTIRPYGNSKYNGFEELVCQLAHLERPETADQFIRKEGAGGDAGVECYWCLNNGNEYGWQAKYFIDGIDSSKWGQITESFKSALEKHKNLTRYYICLPLDRTDSRKKGRGGKQVVSIQDEWKEYTSKWKEFAKEVNRDIEFIFWGKHELVNRLMIDDPLYSGRALYWFDEATLSNDKLKSCFEKARNTLGERYAPEYNVDLPITTVFNGLIQNEDWDKELKDRYNQLKKTYSSFARVEHEAAYLKEQKPVWDKACDRLEKFFSIYRESINQSSFLEKANLLKQNIENVEESIDEYYDLLISIQNSELKYEEKNNLSHIRSKTITIRNEISSFNSFLSSKKLSSAIERTLIISGEAGIGKSHLLCDVAKNNLSKQIPTILFLGQHYTGGNPLRDILDQLDLKSHSYDEILGALDSAGETSGTRALIIIDAINEGRYKEDWYHRLISLFTEIKEYPNIAIAISCRTTYLEYIIPESLLDRETHLIHRGFQGHESRAASIYLSKQGITTPSIPFSTPEFSNPLFLKTFCKGLKENGEQILPNDQLGINQVFDFYIENLQKIITRKRSLRPQDKIVKKAVNKFAAKLYPNHLAGIPWEEAREIIDPLDSKNVSNNTLLEDLISEGILTDDINYTYIDDKKEGTEVVRFTYERFSDHFIASNILDSYQTVEEFNSTLSSEGELQELLLTHQIYKYAGIITALSIQFAEKFNRELIDFIPEDKVKHNHFEILFVDTLIWRSKDSFTERTLELFNTIKSSFFSDRRIDILLRLSCRKNHPWNARLLHKNLVERNMPDRDVFWSIPIAVNDYEEDEEQSESITLTLIKWALNGDLSRLDDEIAILAGIVLLWFTTTTNRKIRDKSTKAFVRLITFKADVIPTLIDKFSAVDDLYLQERFYAGIYGVITNIDDLETINNITAVVYETFFKDEKPVPHLLLRDYARGVIEYAEYKNSLPENINKDLCVPPYDSEWPLENPLDKELDSIIEEEHSKIRSSLLGFVNDFGHYTMNSVHDWSPTSLERDKPQTQLELLEEFGDNLPKELQDSFENFIEIKKKSQNSPFKLDQLFEENEDSNYKSLQELENEYLELLSESLDEKGEEKLRWLSGGLISNQEFEFSRKWAQRWVCKRAYELGWSSEKFDEFEQIYTKNTNRSRPHVERIGKKYQRIAYHEFLAHLSDNLHYIKDWHSGNDKSKYKGPWQSMERDLDPTIWIHETKDPGWSTLTDQYWWSPIAYDFEPLSLKEKKNWLRSTNDLPDFNSLTLVNDHDGLEWYVLRGFNSWKEDEGIDKINMPPRDIWFRINSIIIDKSDKNTLTESIKGKQFISPDLVYCPSLGETFHGEYPWHISCEHLRDWIDPDDYYSDKINVKYIPPVTEYSWEDSNDASINSSMNIYFPSKTLIQNLNLNPIGGTFGKWVCESGKTAFQDPSVYKEGRSHGLIRKGLLDGWLEEKGYQIFWLVGGEKQLYDHNSMKHYGRLVYSGLFQPGDSNIEGELWFEDERRS